MSEAPQGALVSPADWYSTMQPAALTLTPDDTGAASIRRFTDTCAEMHQPALSHNVLCMHLGGPKTVRRWRGGRTTVHDIDLGALTVLPAGQANRWVTHGPIDFAHLTLDAAFLHQIAIEEFDREPGACELIDSVGLRSPQLEGLFHRLLVASEGRGATGRLYPDSLVVVLTAAMLEEHSNLPARPSTPAAHKTGGLAGWRLRRVMDYMADKLRDDISLAELTALTVLSRAQFFRAFKQSTGSSPHRYLTRLRLEEARALLDGAELDVAQVGEAVGLGAGGRFSALFKTRFGVSPRLYRLSRS
ncbi:MAG: AraC family transcriptional regulator [Pseudomonadota bacterium]|nr:AraC family transcriptional regulator [Pseudomonadota bacterium]